MKHTVIWVIATLLQRMVNCSNLGLALEQHEKNLTRYENARTQLDQVVRDYLPSGSGIDSGTTLCDNSTPQRVKLKFGYHGMDENGAYKGWSWHYANVTPSLTEAFRLRITGKDPFGAKDYLYDLYDMALRTEIILDTTLDRYVLVPRVVTPKET